MAKRKPKIEDEVVPEGAILVKNGGPIVHENFPGKPGHVTLVTGSNATGKSYFIKSARALATGDCKELSLRDGAEEGLVSGFGRTIKLTGRVCKVTGNVEVEFFEESFTLATFVDPGSTADDVNSRAQTNDKKRIKALASILGISISDQEIYRLIAGKEKERAEIQDKLDHLHPAAELERQQCLSGIASIEREEKAVARRIISEKTLGIQDPSDYVSSLKRDIDKAANDKEKEAAVLNGQADALEESLPDAKQAGETDEEVLSQAVAAAQNKKQALETRRDSAEQAQKLADAADEVLKAGQGETVESAQKAWDEKCQELNDSEETIIGLERMLREERQNRDVLANRVTELKAALDGATRRKAAMDKARQDLQEKIQAPTDQEWADVEKEIKDASDAMILGADLRRAADTRTEIEEIREDANELAAEAAHLRTAATGVLGLLVNPINDLKCGIEVDAEMRVIADDPVRGRGYYEELSDGTRWKAVFRLMTSMSIGAELPAIVPLPQRCWLELEPKARQEFVEAVAETNLIVYVCMATSKEEVGPDGKMLFVTDPLSSRIIGEET